jgi:flagellar basal-body rod protein FlgB
MFIDRLLNQGSAPVLEATIQFAAARHKLIAEDIVNADTPNYRQKDLSVERFQAMLRDRLDRRGSAGPGSVDFSNIRHAIEHPTRGILFHDGNNRSMEQLMTDEAKNALLHNVAIEMLKKQFSMMEMALRERVG